MFTDQVPRVLAVTHQRVDGLSHARLDCHPLQQQSLEPVDIELREEQPEGRVRGRVGNMVAEQLFEGLAAALVITLHREPRTLVA